MLNSAVERSMTDAGKNDAVDVLVLGLGDVASAVAHFLFLAGYTIALHASSPPKTHRRKMAFADAFWDGESELDGIRSRRVLTSDVGALLKTRSAIPLIVAPLERAVAERDWGVLVDARLNKRTEPPDLTRVVPLTVGLGPGFAPGRNCHMAVETQWGEYLGTVIQQGSTKALSGEPRNIDGIGRERVIYAPSSGRVTCSREIGSIVALHEELLTIDRISLRAPIAGTLRGAVRSGLDVVAGDKLAEIDPRPPESANFSGIGQRPHSIALGVARALEGVRAGTVRTTNGHDCIAGSRAEAG